MRHHTLAVLLLSSTLFTCSQQEAGFGGPGVKLETTREKFSYALGYDFGPNMENIKSGVELKYFMAGLEDYLKQRPPLVDQGARQQLRAEEFTRIGKEYLEQKRLAEENRLQEAEAFLAANQSKPGVITTASGLQYQVIQEGAGAKPGLNDHVKIKARGTFLDGKEFENTDKLVKGHGLYWVSGAFPGWKEGFQLMRVGGKYRLFLPSRLAFGQIGREPDVPSNALLIYEIELLEIVAKAD